ncbi:MAG: cyclic nucleotide-binding domain-containing protein, partial [Treponema sp.]|nr:cyclic nucleotide-binding domain-containing protein [Treponema sp.]
MSALNIDKTLVQQTDLFSSLPQNEVDFIVSHCGNLKLAKGSLLFSPDEEAKQFYILTSGSIRVYKRRDDGGEEEMALFTPGDTIGDFDFARGAIYDAFAEAGEDSELIEFPGYGHSVDSLAAEQPGTISNMLLNAIVMMTGRIKSANRLILDNMSWVQELHRRAYEDSSTGLWKQSLINDEITGVLSDPSALIMIKPDRFKILVDSLGHSAGDEAMIRIAIILKNMTRQVGNGWALRFKSNEVGLIFNNCDAAQAEKISKEVYDSITAMEPVPAQADFPGFHFTATISWAVWPLDNPQWDSFFQG